MGLKLSFEAENKGQGFLMDRDEAKKLKHGTGFRDIVPFHVPCLKSVNGTVEGGTCPGDNPL